MKKVLLYSGGMDSWLISKLYRPDVKVYINVGNTYSQYEIRRLPLDVYVKEMFFLGELERQDKIIPLRNAYFLLYASNFGEEICLGATKGDRVLDKSYDFANKITDLINYLYQPQHWTIGKEFKLNLSYKEYTKTQLVKKYKDAGGDLEKAFKESFSCYYPINGHECWECKPCFRKWVSFKLNGYIPDKRINEIVIPYILREIYPKILKNEYGRAEEEKDIVKAIKEFL